MTARKNGIGIPDRPPVGQRDLPSKADKPRTGLKVSQKKHSMTPAQMTTLEKVVVSRDGRCVVADHTFSDCDGKTDPHHIVPKRVIRDHYPAGHKVFSDKRNVVALCRRHHNVIERRLFYLPDECLPRGFDEFLDTYGFVISWEFDQARRQPPPGQ